jgi:2-dehydropantoate 2-reductase
MGDPGDNRAGENRRAGDNRLLIVGTGAMGCLFAARCAAAGQAVTLLGTWREGILALNDQGVCLVGPDGQERSYRVQAYDDTSRALANGKFNQALVLVKSWKTVSAAHVLDECLTERGVALSLQNGLGNYEILTARLGSHRVAFGVTTQGATLLAPALVRPSGNGQISLAAGDNLGQIAHTLERAGFLVLIEPDLRRLLWRKLAINAAINSLTALLNVPNGELLDMPSAHYLLKEIVAEVVRVAASQEVEISTAETVETVENVARQTAANISSMLQDIHRGAPTENEAINGSILRKAETAGIPCPVTTAVYWMVRAIVERNAGDAYAEG